MAGHSGRFRAGRTGPGVANADGAHPRAGGALRETVAGIGVGCGGVILNAAMRVGWI